MRKKNHKIVIQKIIIKKNNMYLHFIKTKIKQLLKITLCRNLLKILQNNKKKKKNIMNKHKHWMSIINNQQYKNKILLKGLLLHKKSKK